YLRAKVAQENLITESNLPYSIIHATQFFEFFKSIADAATQAGQVCLPPVLFQPIASEDVAKVVAEVAVGAPLNGILEIAGPDQFRFDEFIRVGLEAIGDKREVLADKDAKYFGTRL